MRREFKIPKQRNLRRRTCFPRHHQRIRMRIRHRLKGRVRQTQVDRTEEADRPCLRCRQRRECSGSGYRA